MILRSEDEIFSNWGNSSIKDPIVTIRCLTYNHEKYIEECLNSFLMQKTTFPFEIVVHDDASTDHTAEIVRQFEKKYPRIIHAIYEEENIYSRNNYDLKRIVDRACSGKFIAFCEGDDYWISEDKLQLQYEALMKSPQCSMCTCVVNCCNEDGSYNERHYPDSKWNLDGYNGIIPYEQLTQMLFSGYPFHTSSYFIRSEVYFKELEGVSEWFTRDVGVMLKAWLAGPFFHIDKPMSMRRFGAKDSWANVTKRAGKYGRYTWGKKNFHMYSAVDIYTKGTYREMIFATIMLSLFWIQSYNKDEANVLDSQYRSKIGVYEYAKWCIKSWVRNDITYKTQLIAFKTSPRLFEKLSSVWHKYNELTGKIKY